jgi:outer membrane protein insertion porin family
LVFTGLGKSVRVAIQGSLGLALALGCAAHGGAQKLAAVPAQTRGGSPLAAAPAPSQDMPRQSLLDWAGLRVTGIQFEGVAAETLKPLPSQLAQQVGQPLDPQKIRDSLRRLFATGLYQTIQVDGVRVGDDVSIIFSGAPKLFIGRVEVNGVSGGRLTGVLQSATQLQPGTAYSPDKATEADAGVQNTLQDNGYYRGQVARTEVLDSANSLIDFDYEVTTGNPARVGEVDVKGTPGTSESQFRKNAKLKRNSKVNRNTVSRALTRLRKHYVKQSRLEAAVTLTSKQYAPPTNHLNYSFLANQGPIVDVRVEGAKIRKSALQKLVPVYEEGAVDQDLLNEGAQNLRNYYQSKGYFDVQVSHEPVHANPEHVTALYTVNPGPIHIVESVSFTGNKYFSKDLIEDRISVHPATLLDPHGVYSQQLVNSDINSIKALYQSNGFSNVKVTPKIIDVSAPQQKSKKARLKVVYAIDEGQQQRIGKYEITGATPEQLADLRRELNTQVGQPYSSLNLTQDRDAALTYYLSHGYDNVEINLYQETEADHPELVDAMMNIVPGMQFFVRQVVISGIHYTKPAVVDQRILLHAGDPLNQSALLETQRKLYDLGLFSEANLAVQNPDGNETYKNVLLNLIEAKRWDFNYGFGFEAQTGTPTQSCLSPAEQIILGISNSYKCTPNGHFGASPRILFNIGRTNLRGTDQSITLRTNYGTLEQVATLTYQDPHVFNRPNFTFSLSGGYNNSAYISTYTASVLSASLRISQHVNKANTLIYSQSYRRVAVNPATLQVSLALIPTLSEPTKIGGPGVTWIRDTRDVPLDAHRGTFTTAEQFLADGNFGSQANFDRLDLTNASYYQFGRERWVFARQTRYAQERAYGNGDQELIPLPERLYAGGPTSLRGFALNSAGPRDPQTGYPVGGSGAFVNNTELRMPPPVLPYVGTNVSFVLFHDMGNVFQNASQIWPSFFRIKQPHSYTCRDLSAPFPTYNTPDTCDFNDFSHALGLGARYHTPIGPVRVDFAYNLNPPIFPVFYDYTSNSPNPNPHVGQASHFNFAFSIGQSF